MAAADPAEFRDRGPGAEGVLRGVADPARVQAVVDRTAEVFGKVDVRARANAIAPGFFHPRLTEGDIERAEASIKARPPLPRVGREGELKGVAGFLTSGASNYITGQTIVVDGGRTIV